MSTFPIFQFQDDFKPASVDVNKEATLETGSNNTVTVTLPHTGKHHFAICFVIKISYIHFLISNYNSDNSGVPNTIFKGNQRDYTKKECILIINRETNEITLEKLHSNIQVKKTRTDSSNKSSQQQLQMQPQQSATQQPTLTMNTNNNNNGLVKTDNVTSRHNSKTRVSTGVRKTNMNNILNFVPKNSPTTLQGSPSYPHPHRSPQQAPLYVQYCHISCCYIYLTIFYYCNTDGMLIIHSKRCQVFQAYWMTTILPIIKRHRHRRHHLCTVTIKVIMLAII